MYIQMSNIIKYHQISSNIWRFGKYIMHAIACHFPSLRTNINGTQLPPGCHDELKDRRVMKARRVHSASGSDWANLMGSGSREI